MWNAACVFKEGGGWRGVPDRLRAAVADRCGQRPVQWHSYVMCGMSQPEGGLQYEVAASSTALPAWTKHQFVVAAAVIKCCSCATLTNLYFVI